MWLKGNIEDFLNVSRNMVVKHETTLGDLMYFKVITIEGVGYCKNTSETIQALQANNISFEIVEELPQT